MVREGERRRAAVTPPPPLGESGRCCCCCCCWCWSGEGGGTSNADDEAAAAEAEMREEEEEVGCARAEVVVDAMGVGATRFFGFLPRPPSDRDGAVVGRAAGGAPSGGKSAAPLPKPLLAAAAPLSTAEVRLGCCCGGSVAVLLLADLSAAGSGDLGASLRATPGCCW